MSYGKTIVGLTGQQIEDCLNEVKDKKPDMGMSRVGMMELEQLRRLVGDVHAVLEAYMASGDIRLPAVAKHLIDLDRDIRHGK